MRTVTTPEPIEQMPPTIGLKEVARLLRMSESALMRKARVGKVAGAKIGRQWVFVQADLIELIRELARKRMGRPYLPAQIDSE